MTSLDDIELVPSLHNRPLKINVPHGKQGRALHSRPNQKHRKMIETSSGNESSGDEVADDEDDEASDDDEDDDGDDESDQPAALPPPRGIKRQSFREAGRLAEYRRMFHSEDPVLYEDPQDLFGASLEDEDDDDLYRAVDDISDDDEHNTEVFPLNGTTGSAITNLFPEQSVPPYPLSDPENEVNFILDQVDGLSAYGFGNDLETGDGSGEFSAPSEDDEFLAAPERHVHFGSDVEHMTAYGKATSPSLTRALLPSAFSLGDDRLVCRVDASRLMAKHDTCAAMEDPYDSDATEVIHQPPSPIQRTSSITHHAEEVEYLPSPVPNSPSPTKENKKRSSRRKKGPRRGIFTVDQDKSWAILDSTGKKILQIPAANTNRHAWLDEMSQSTSTPSTSASPMNASLKLRGEATASVVPAANAGLVINTALPDVMMAGLSGKNPLTEGDRGLTVGPPEAFYSSGLQLVGGDYAITPEPESDAYEEATPITKKVGFPLAEFLEDLGDDDSDDADCALPLFAPADENLTGDNEGLFDHLNNVDITAFRPCADPMSASRPSTAYSYDLQMSPTAALSFALPAVPIKTPKPSHKRKVSTTPYQDEKIYGDVTPVERKVISLSKRRRLAA